MVKKMGGGGGGLRQAKVGLLASIMITVIHLTEDAPFLGLIFGTSEET